MTQVSVMELAKQGDPHAIAALINRSLESKGIHAQAQLESECLKISLQASQVPNQKAVVTIIHRGMVILQIPQIKHVKILTYRSDNNYLAWQHEFSLGNDDPNASPQPPVSEPAKPKSSPSSSDLVQDSNIHLANNYSHNYQGVILVQKLSQIQQNLQEYQDIIVRFTDEHVGTVRCLTTLTELIQVISKPSFLFAAVAANPSLRSLLDTIAEFSKTDEHGDQVITNLSILQPGQQWQKAKIRLVSKIFLEPAQDVTNVDKTHQGITLDLDKPPHQNVGYSVLETAEPPRQRTEPTSSPNYDQSSQSNEKISEALFENFLEPNIQSPQGLPELETVEPLTSVNTVESLFEDFSTKADQIASTKNMSDSPAEDLFDNFSDAPTALSELPESIDMAVPPSNNKESLFDDFLDTDITEVSSEYSGISNLDESLSISLSEVRDFKQVDDQTAPNRDESDLFSGFSIDQPSLKQGHRNPDKAENTATPNHLDAIKSKIPKQDLENLLKLMDEQEQSQIEDVMPEKQSQQESHDLGATTIESILGNMETLVLDSDSTKSDSDFVTLEKFSNDLDSLGF